MCDIAACNHLRDDLCQLMDQGLALLDRLDADTYCREHPEFALASIGDHYRHHLDFIAAFVRGVKRGRIDYDDRRRNQWIAMVPDIAAEETRWLQAELGRLCWKSVPDELAVVQRTRDDGDDRQLVSSRVARELAYLFAHSMHHYAIMAVAVRLAEEMPPSDFGVMPSTLQHCRSGAAE